MGPGEVVFGHRPEEPLQVVGARSYIFAGFFQPRFQIGLLHIPVGKPVGQRRVVDGRFEIDAAEKGE